MATSRVIDAEADTHESSILLRDVKKMKNAYCEDVARHRVNDWNHSGNLWRTDRIRRNVRDPW